MDIGGHSCLWHVMERVKLAGLPYILTVPATADEDPLYQYATGMGWPVSRGPHPDMVAAFLQAVTDAHSRGTLIVRVTADCPFVQIGDIQRYARALTDAGPDGYGYVSNAHPVRTIAKGLDVEAFTYWSLSAAQSGSVEERHHVTPAIRRMLGLATNTDDGEFRVTLDTAEDLAVLQDIGRTLNVTPPHPTVKELRAYFRSQATGD